MTSAPKWRLNEQMTSAPKLEVNNRVTSAPKWEQVDQALSVLKAVSVLKPRGRKGIPAAIVRQVWERDDYCCVNMDTDGSRCASKIGLQVDHVRPVAFGQDNRMENLRLLCRQCNVATAEEILGTAVMERYRWIKSRKDEEVVY
jgi:5-methylcytosine-specific restriction endonuclease McrA